MRRRFGWSSALATLWLAAGAGPIAHGQEPARAAPPSPAAKPDGPLAKAEAFVRPPLPPEPIPRRPAAVRGAMFRLAERIEPPDIILVEVLEALPGRPITGERLAGPDGEDRGASGSTARSPSTASPRSRPRSRSCST